MAALRLLCLFLMVAAACLPAQVSPAALGSPQALGSEPAHASSGEDSPRRPLAPSARYRLRAGDVVSVAYRYTPDFNQTVTIEPDGYIDIPAVGSLHLAGLTLEEARTQMTERAARTLRDPVLDVTLRQFERPFFVVAGEVDHPGRFDFYEKTTALGAVLEAGGFKSTAQQSEIYVFRRVAGDLREVHRLNLKNVRADHDLDRDLVLEPGDMILVPRNRLEKISRFIKSSNLNLYFDPLTYALR